MRRAQPAVVYHCRHDRYTTSAARQVIPLDQLLPPDHEARTVWAYVDGLDLSLLLTRILMVPVNRP